MASGFLLPLLSAVIFRHEVLWWQRREAPRYLYDTVRYGSNCSLVRALKF